MTTILVCGGRDYHDYACINKTLSQFHNEHNIDCIIHGGASGADSLAAHWAECNQINCIRIPAKWKLHGNSAGPIRNSEMLAFCAKHNLTLTSVIAFPGGNGTSNMIRLAEKAGIQVLKVEV